MPRNDIDEDGYWCEVPQAVFLAWSDAEQYAYCARRDRHSAAQAEDVVDQQFFTERAVWYEEHCI